MSGQQTFLLEIPEIVKLRHTFASLTADEIRATPELYQHFANDLNKMIDPNELNQDLEELLALQDSVAYYERMMRTGPSSVDFEPMLAIAQYQLADYYIQWQRYAEAINILINCIHTLKDASLVEQTMNDLFLTLGEEHELVKEARKHLGDR